LPPFEIVAVTARTLRRFGLVPLIVVALTPLACREAATSLGTTPAVAHANADELLGSLSARFGPSELDPAFATARPKLARSALTPSRIYDDAALWTSMHEPVRTLELSGRGVPGHYLIAARADAPAPAAPADYRGSTRLVHRGDDEYEWTVRDELAIGTITAADLDRALTTLFSAAERRDERALRAEYRSLLPRATRALGRLFSLDTLRLAPSKDGATAVDLAITMHPEHIASDFPSYAKFLDKYVSPTSLDAVVYDDEGHRWWQAHADKERLSLKFRVHRGSLAPLNAAPRRIPPNVHVRVDAMTKAWVFKVGLKQLIADVTLTRDAHEKGFVARFRREPDWEFPPLVEQMLQTPLRRPFEEGGATLSYAVRDSAGAQTLALREYRIAVQESTIMRWFGGLGRSALDEFRKGAEKEADRFSLESLNALHADLLALTTP
jgi:hypothetical protein